MIVFGLYSGIGFQFIEFSGTSVVNLFGNILSSIVLPILILFPFFLFKVLGAGDVKLFSVIGSYFGIAFVTRTILYSFLMGALLSLVYLIKERQFQQRLTYFMNYFRQIQYRSSNFVEETEKDSFVIPPYYDVKKNNYQGVIHFSLSIFFAVLIQLLLESFPNS